MRALLIILLALTTINCSKVKFSNDKLEEIKDHGIDLDGDDDDDGDETDDDGEICPRYDLVVKSAHQSNNKLNYRFTFNGELKHSSTEGEIDVLFLKDGNKKFTQCSGSYTNTAVTPNLEPLKAVESLTAEIEITHGQACATVVPERTTYMQVIDNATGDILWDEEEIIDYIGACEFGYSTTGQDLRKKIMNLADGVVNNMADACNK